MAPTTVQNQYDILGIGCCAVDELLIVPAYPAADSKIQVIERKTRLGGLTGAALIAAAQLGGRCAYAGRLGGDAASKFTAATLKDSGVDVSHVPYESDAVVIQSTIVVAEDTGGRNIFFSCDGKIGAHPELPGDEVILSSRVLLLDHFGMDGNLRAAQFARAHQIPIVADFEDNADPQFLKLFDLVDHLILSTDMAQRITGLADAERAVQSVWNESRAVAIVTSGAEGCWAMTNRFDRPHHFPAFRIQAIDTTGCGDVFHGAYALALAWGNSFERRVRVATAAAAVKASQPGPIDIHAVNQLLNP